jgi:hypothetical protein
MRFLKRQQAIQAYNRPAYRLRCNRPWSGWRAEFEEMVRLGCRANSLPRDGATGEFDFKHER